MGCVFVFSLQRISMSRKSSWFRGDSLIWFVFRQSNIAGKPKMFRLTNFNTLYQHSQLRILRLSQMQPSRVTKKTVKIFTLTLDIMAAVSENSGFFAIEVFAV